MSEKLQGGLPTELGDRGGNRIYYFVPSDGAASRDESLDLGALLRSVWKGKWLIATVALAFAALGVAYALLAEQKFRAEVSLLPSENRSVQGLSGTLSQLGGLGGLASLAGINIGSNSRAEPVAILKSRDFARSFIQDNSLMPVLLAERWDKQRQQWKQSHGDKPDIRDAVETFEKSVLNVLEDRKTGLVKVAIVWRDPVVAADWANQYVRRLNERMRERALVDSKANIDYLQGQMKSAEQVSLQQSIGKLLESEMEKSMVARGTEEYAFRIVDKAVPPKKRVWPKRTLVVILAFMLGSLMGLATVLFRERRVLNRQAELEPAL